MNWLAHILLSDNHFEHQLGNLLADHLKGRHWEGASHHVVLGMEAHKDIDRFTDQHPIFIRSKNRLASKGLLRGVVIDILYDHFLTLHWDRFCSNSLNDFTDQFYRFARSYSKPIPSSAACLLESLVKYRGLNEYGTLDGVKLALARIDLRASQRLREREQAVSYVFAVEQKIDHFEDDFLLFFPELFQYSRSLLK